MRMRAGGRAMVAAALLCALPATATPAHATGYRYWSFWQRDHGRWVYAQEGPATSHPADGDVEGWRFAVSADSSTKAVWPRGPAEFTTICAHTPARGGSKRVALVIDFGTMADAPRGERPPQTRTACARVPRDATSADAVAAVAKPLRYDSNGLLCAIGGYPAAGCGETVSTKNGSSAGSSGGGHSGGGGPAAGLWAGLGAVAVLAGAGVWQTRRRRRT
jgi:hypothetical protein